MKKRCKPVKRKHNPTLSVSPALVQSFMASMLGQIAGKIVSDAMEEALDEIRRSTAFQADEPSDPLREVAEEKLREEKE